VLFAQVLGFIGPAFIVISSTLARQDPELEEAAESQGASRWQIFTRLSLPMAWPGLARAFLLVFVLSMTDFGNPTVVGQNFSVLATEIYGQIIANRNHPLAAALCVWLILSAAVLYALVELASRRRRFTIRLTVAPARRLAVPPGVRGASSAWPRSSPAPSHWFSSPLSPVPSCANGVWTIHPRWFTSWASAPTKRSGGPASVPAGSAST
jgi:iron(III) transport system permease protein